MRCLLDNNAKSLTGAPAAPAGGPVSAGRVPPSSVESFRAARCKKSRRMLIASEGVKIRNTIGKNNFGDF